MSLRRRLGALAVVGAVAAVTVACGSAASPAAAPASPPALPGLATSVVTTTGPTWAVVVMGGSAAQYNNFWQIFTRPAGSAHWRLVTPPGVASNGGFVIADGGTGSLTAGFRPSQDLVFTPLAATSDDGSAWTSGILDASLADAADALAVSDGALLALLSNGTVQLSASGGANWTTLTTLRSLAASAPGRQCGLRTLTGTAFTAAHAALLAGDCTHAGVTGIFAESDGAWHLAGPALAGPLARENVSVLALAPTPGGVAALLAAGTGQGASLIGAWLAGTSSHWVMSAPLPLRGAAVTSASFGPRGQAAVVLTGDQGETLAAPGGSWQSLPALPSGTATLALPVSGAAVEALAVHSATLTVWQVASDHSMWQSAQVIKVPIQYGSSD
jgi:hypothetical protein